MIVVMHENASDAQIEAVVTRLKNSGFDIHRSTGVAQSVLGAVGVKPDFDHRDIELLEGVQEVHRISSPYKLASRQFRPEGSVVQLGKGVADVFDSVLDPAVTLQLAERRSLGKVADNVWRVYVRNCRKLACAPQAMEPFG